MPPLDIEATRKTITSIYAKHGFVVKAWLNNGLKCYVGQACELHDLSDEEVDRRIKAAWKEIDAVIHEM